MFVLLGIVGWILARTQEFEIIQKILISIVFTIFNTVILFYFYDAYSDIGRVRTELIAHRHASNLIVVKNGISDNLVSFDPIDRFLSVATFIIMFWLFVVIIVWAKKH